MSGLLAALISLALVASLFHCCCTDGDEGKLTISAAQTSYDGPGKETSKTAPCSTAAHCCHCLAHATTMAPQDDVASIEYVLRFDGLAAAPAPDTADPASPFKPPRA